MDHEHSKMWCLPLRVPCQFLRDLDSKQNLMSSWSMVLMISVGQAKHLLATESHDICMVK